MTEAEVKKAKRKLYEEARKKFPEDSARQAQYVYGALRKQGWKPKREK